MNIETRIKLDKFKPRDYQIPICDAILNPEKDYKKVFVVMPRRARQRRRSVQYFNT